MADLNRIQFKRTSTAGRKPDASILSPGELAINLADRELFTKDDSNNVITLGDFRGELPTDANLDNYGPTGKFTGIWSKSTSTNAQPTHKFPEENAVGVLEVFVAGQFAGTQRYTTRYGNIFIRSLTAKWNGTNGPWSPWRNVQAGTRPLSTTIDLNDLGDASHFGLWRNSSNSIATLERNFPEAGSAAQGLLEVFEGGNYSRTQRYTTRYGVVYTRCLAAAWDAAAPNWGPWQQVGHGTPATFYDGDLNNFKTPGLYNILGTDQVINCPTGEGLPAVIVGLLEVKQRASGGAIFQKFTTAGTGTTTRGRIFERAMTNNIWGAWNEVYTSYSMPITLGIGERAIELTSMDWQQQEFLSGGIYSVAAKDMTNTPSGMTFADVAVYISVIGRSGNALELSVIPRTSNDKNYHCYNVRSTGAKGSRTFYVRKFATTSTQHTWTAQQDFKGAVNFGAATTFKSTATFNTTATFKTEVKFNSSNAFRMYGGNFGAFMRNDGESVYLLSTEENDKDGSFNTNRPFRYELKSGDVTLGGTSGANALKLKRDSLTAFFGGDINLSKGYLTFEAGRLYSRDYFRFNHWGDSNNARDNIIQLEDSQGAHFSTERQMSNGAIKTKFFGQVESNGRMKINALGDAIVLNAASNSSIHIRADVAGASNWYIGKGGNDNSISMYSYVTKGGIAISNNGEVALNPQGSGLMSVNRDRVHINGSGWIARHSGAWIDQWREEAPIFIDHGSVGQDSYYPLLKGRSQITGQGYLTAVDFGLRRVPSKWGQAIIRVASAEASPTSGHPQAVYEFHHDGTFYSPGNGNFNDVYIRSDSRLKINKEEYQANATDKVNTLKVYTYDKVKSLSDRSVIAREVGIIAQDLEKELPEAVKTSNVDGSDVLTISNSAVNALLIKAFQEMSEELKAVKAKLAALEKN